MNFYLKKILASRLESATILGDKNGHFDIGCVAQHPQNTRERLQLLAERFAVKAIELLSNTEQAGNQRR